MKQWLLLALLLALFSFTACVGDDDDNDDGADDDAIDDDAGDDDDDDGDDDDVDDDTADDDTADDDTVEEEWPGPPWYGCTEEDEPADATVITAFDLADQYYGDPDLRTINAEVNFPTSGDWEQVTMRLELSCPADGDCDDWDRLASVYLVNDPGTVDEEVMELWRYITPYNIGMCMLVDVTAYKNLLVGTQTIRSLIDTWVGPDSSSGHGWRVTLKFIFHPAKDENTPDQIFNLWPWVVLELGNPDNSVPTQLGEATALLPATVSRAELRVVATGHGQGNRSNCGEFCSLDHQVLVNGTSYWFNPWRGDCAHNPLKDQDGTWPYNRNGWCPGAPVEPQIVDVTDDVLAGVENVIGYDIVVDEGVAYENTCRPGAGDENNYCEGCVFDDQPGNCDYNGSYHTTPIELLSVQLYVWE